MNYLHTCVDVPHYSNSFNDSIIFDSLTYNVLSGRKTPTQPTVLFHPLNVILNVIKEYLIWHHPFLKTSHLLLTGEYLLE